jgi:hypothetical protein
LCAGTTDTQILFGGGSERIVDIYNSITDTWTVANLTAVGTAPACGSANNFVLFAGGQINGTAVDGVDIYNGTSNTWKTSRMYQPLSGLTSVGIGIRIFSGGGFTCCNLINRNIVEFLDTLTGGFYSNGSLSVGRNDLTSAALGDKVFFAGGVLRNGSYSNLVDVFIISNLSWGSPQQLSQARSRLVSATVGSKILFAGGFKIGQWPAPGQYLDTVDIYDTLTETWSVAHLSVARSNLAATSVGNLAFFAGGTSGSGLITDVVDIYNAETNTWSVTTLSTKRAFLTAASLGTKAYFAGGLSGTPVDVIDIYETATGTWDKPRSNPPPTQSQQSSAAYVVIPWICGYVLFLLVLYSEKKSTD